MGSIASQITSLTIIYSTVYSGADQRKYQSCASLAFVRGIHRWPVTRKMSPFDDVIMIEYICVHVSWDVLYILWLHLVWLFSRNFGNVLHLARLFHAPQTIRGRELRSRSAFCCWWSNPLRAMSIISYIDIYIYFLDIELNNKGK